MVKFFVVFSFFSLKKRNAVMVGARNLQGSDPPLFLGKDVSETVRNKQIFSPLINSLMCVCVCVCVLSLIHI